VAQEVPFPRFGLQLKEGQSAEEFMDEIEKKVNAMIGESTMNEYKAYNNLVKHKRRINRVFSEICGEKSFCSRRPGVPVKVPAVVVASYSAAPLKAPRRSSLKKGKGDIDETSSSALRPEKTRSLESSKRKRKSSEIVSDIELQAASSLAQLSQKKTKKAVKKIVVTEVRRVPSALDENMIVEPSHKGFFLFRVV
jgi:DNA-directed RNA polymerase subunit N (RpoN/RPB10)